MKQLENHKYYYIDTEGNVYSTISNKFLKPLEHHKGYLKVRLKTNDMSSHVNHFIHRLVLETFKGDNPELQCNHIDGDKKNNCLSNLEWVTQSQNQIHARNLGLTKSGEDHFLSKLNLRQVEEIRGLKGKMSSRKVGNEYKVTHSNILAIWKGKSWKNVGDVKLYSKE